MFRLTRIRIDTHSEHVIFLHREAATRGSLGLEPLDRVKVTGRHPISGETREIQGILNFCHDSLVTPNSVGLSESAFADLDRHLKQFTTNNHSAAQHPGGGVR